MNFLSKIYWRFIASPEQYARRIGVKIGKNCLIETRNWSSEPYLITIGDNVQITMNVYFHTHGGGHVVRNRIPNFDYFGKITVEDNAYIGANSQIMPGVTIGKGALVAAGSIVTKSVLPGTVVGGNPAKFLCTVNDFLERNLKYNIGTKGWSYMEKKEKLIKLDDRMFVRK